jgi:tRNA-splicing ligase RtcB
MKVVATERIPIKMWLEDLEEGAMEQAKNLANVPYSWHHIAIMPDSHKGFGMPIGSVLVTKNVIVPNAVGVDIGCGMNAVRTTIRNEDIMYNVIEDIMKRVERDIPVGFSQNKESLKHLLPVPEHYHVSEYSVVNREYEKSGYQLGTLGGGNHFIEMDAGSDGYVYLILHSGSRGIGNQVGQHYNKRAEAINEKYYQLDTVKKELAFLPVDDEEAVEYVREMNFCFAYAEKSRAIMMDKFKQDVLEVIPYASFDQEITISHNFASLEYHFGRNVWVHRKGAVQAYEGQKGIIAGSQGTASYIVEGKGNIDSFKTCSHGAGRVMGRKEAQRKLSLNEEQEKMEGIYNNMRTRESLDEAPSAYKDIEEVMKQQDDLVKILVKLKPLGVVKG